MGGKGTARERRANEPCRIRLAAAIDLKLYDLGLTSSRFGRMIGVGTSTVEKWRSMGMTPESKHFMAVMEALGLDPYEYGKESTELGEKF